MTHQAISVRVNAHYANATRVTALPRHCSRTSVAPLDTVHFRSVVGAIGTFHCPIEHPAFRDTGTIEESIVVFPRTSVWIQHEGSRPFVADPNIVTIYNRAQRYARSPLSPDGDVCDWFAVADDVAREIVAHFDPATADRCERPFRFAFAPNTSDLYFAQRALVRHASDIATPGASIDMSDALIVEEKLLSVVARVLALAYRRQVRDHVGLTRVARRRVDLVEGAKVEILRTATENRSVRDIAQTVGCSVFHLCRIFREFTGRSMHEYRTDLRLRLLLERLEDERKGSLSEIAHSLGFASHAHLVRECRRHLGAPPGALRHALLAPHLAFATTGPAAFPSA
ncbi:MAG: AraC family transcriptional regulator [Gemmatimonadaceae bacterium]